MVEMYASGATVEVIANAVGKSVRSVVAKLSREQVYKPKAQAKTERGATKTELIDQLATKLEVPAEKLESLEKATKEALVALVEAL